MEDVRRILAVSDGTEWCRKAVHYGFALARTCGAELLVVHLLAKNPFELSGGEPVDTVEHDYKGYETRARALLDELVSAESRRGIRVRELVRYGNPSRELEKLVQAEGVDLIVMAARREGRVEHHLKRGREKLVREMPCSVLLVRMPAAEEGEEV